MDIISRFNENNIQPVITKYNLINVISIHLTNHCHKEQQILKLIFNCPTTLIIKSDYYLIMSISIITFNNIDWPEIFTPLQVSNYVVIFTFRLRHHKELILSPREKTKI